MRVSIGLGSYLIHARRKHSRTEFYDLDALPDGRDLIDEIADFLFAAEASAIVDNSGQTMLTARDIDVNKNRVVTAVVETGDFGFEARGINITNYKTAYTRTAEHAELMPFALRVFVPAGSTRAVMLLQRHGNRSPFSSVYAALRHYLSETQPQVALLVGDLIPESLLQEVTAKDVREIEIQYLTIPNDIATQVSKLGSVTGVASATLTIRPEKGLFLGLGAKIASILSGQHPAAAVLPYSQDEQVRVAISVDYNGKRRKIVLGDQSTIAPFWDVTNQVGVQSNGHPDQKKLGKVMRGYLRSICEEIGIAPPGPGGTP